MIDLKCKCTSCAHNFCSNCKAKQIEVTNQTICSSYREKRGSSNAEFADEIFEPLIRQSTDVCCNANCSFSQDGVCVANGITVGNLQNNASCETFLPN